MKVLVTGADGFIGKNLCAHLATNNDISVLSFTRSNSVQDLCTMAEEADVVCHLAGVNRTQELDEFKRGNIDITLALCEAFSKLNKSVPIIYASSIQADQSTPYGLTKHSAEEILIDYSNRHDSPLYIYRLPNVFGKWAKPNYNSAVATFCNNIARDMPIQINDAFAELNLVYIDDVVAQFVNDIEGKSLHQNLFCSIQPVYNTTVGELAEQIKLFRESRNTLVTEAVGAGFVRALYSTYISYLPTQSFSYDIPQYIDARGAFVEMLKTRDSGQFSYFTALPGVTRGGHYHHSKTEKFLVIKGQARFRFRHIVSGEYYEIRTSGDKPELVETVPGWTHDITNLGQDEMIVMLWANEIFDRNFPDTFMCEI